ncbi:flagellar motor switch protein FliM [Cryobacterium sp. MLB-32]|uniref:flagellar motor switch protein FliM n=1 Tax=Cryobacterium sp. MLB-32 TaxID=1529318 RepID=UPI001E5EA0E4|nr:flagellar motor switch protein FliM [Cryobacterium sp. MLB-32]
MTVQEQVSRGVPAKPPETVEVYDFRRPTTLAREHGRVLELAFETFARQWGTQLTARVRLLCQVTCDLVLMQTYDEYAASLPSTTAMVLCSIDGIDAKTVMQFPTRTALSWVDHMLGGNGSKATKEERKFTPIEQALVRHLVEEGLEDLRYSLGDLLLTDVTMDGIQYNSQFAQAAATGDLMIVATFGIRTGNETPVIATIAIPEHALMPQLGEANPKSLAENARERLEQQLAFVPVEVSLRLNPIQVLPNRILTLAVGDVLAIPHPQHRPLELVVNSQVLATAAVGVNGSRLACIVIDTEEKSP